MTGRIKPGLVANILLGSQLAAPCRWPGRYPTTCEDRYGERDAPASQATGPAVPTRITGNARLGPGSSEHAARPAPMAAFAASIVNID